MNSADMREVWKRLAERRRGTYGELADRIRICGRQINPYWTSSLPEKAGSFKDALAAMQGCRE